MTKIKILDGSLSYVHLKNYMSMYDKNNYNIVK